MLHLLTLRARIRSYAMISDHNTFTPRANTNISDDMTMDTIPEEQTFSTKRIKLQKLLSTIQKTTVASSLYDEIDISRHGNKQIGSNEKIKYHRKELEQHRNLYLAVLNSANKIIDLGMSDERYIDWMTTFLANFKVPGP